MGAPPQGAARTGLGRRHPGGGEAKGGTRDKGMGSRYCIGIDIGGTYIKMGLFDAEGGRHAFQRAPSNATGPPEALVGALIQACGDLMETARLQSGRVVAVGLGIAGKLDPAAGRVVFSPNLPNMAGFALAPRLQEALEIPVFMENDANVFGLGEAWMGQGRKIPNWIGVTLGTGVGGCLIADGALWLGDRLGFAGEIGHMIVDPQGPPCACGQTGCLEAHASGSALIRGMIKALDAGAVFPERMAQALHTGSLTPEDVYQAAEAGEPHAQHLFRRMGWALGLALGNLFTFLGIESAIIGGGVSQAWDQFHPHMMETLRTVPKMLDPDGLRIFRTALGPLAPLYGAARLAWNGLDRS